MGSHGGTLHGAVINLIIISITTKMNQPQKQIREVLKISVLMDKVLVFLIDNFNSFECFPVLCLKIG